MFFFLLAEPPVVNTTLWSILGSNNPVYARPNNTNSTYFYDTFKIVVPTTGFYGIGTNSNFDTYGYLYSVTFVPDAPLEFLAASDDDSGGNGQFQIKAYLERYFTYTLVATTFDEQKVGSYVVIVSGPRQAELIRTTPNISTSTQTTGHSYNTSTARE